MTTEKKNSRKKGRNMGILKWLMYNLDRNYCRKTARYGEGSAEIAKLIMERKTGAVWDMYKCIWCKSYHLRSSK